MEILQILKALADENRIRIVSLLKQQELCVCEIEAILGINQSNLSRHLHKLSAVQLIKRTKKSQWVYYQTNQQLLEQYPFLKKIFNRELAQVKPYKDDYEKLRKYKRSRMNCDRLDSKRSKDQSPAKLKESSAGVEHI